METCHIIKLSDTKIAIADLIQPGELFPGWTISRLNVPMEFRGQGYGSQLLKRITEQADVENLDLYLQVYPSGGLNEDELFAWYRRHGFKHLRGWREHMRRRPFGRVPSFEETHDTHKILCG